MSSEALPTLFDENLPANTRDEHFDGVASSSNFLPRLALQISTSKKCQSGEFPVNHYASIKDQSFTDVGAEVDILVCEWRPFAIDFNDGVKKSYDPDSDLYKDILDRVAPNSGCQAGPQFLVWITATQKFATFYMASSSARRESPAVKALMRQGCTLKAHLIKGTQHNWYAPQAFPCSSLANLPDKDELTAEIEKFLNPTDGSDVGVTDDDQSDATGDREV